MELNEKELLTHLYHTEGMSLSQMAKVFGIGVTTLSKRMRAHGIEIKKPGGAYNASWAARKLFRMDQRVVLTLPIERLSRIIKIHPNTIGRYRRNRGLLHNHTN